MNSKLDEINKFIDETEHAILVLKAKIQISTTTTNTEILELSLINLQIQLTNLKIIKLFFID
jgi:hypothetical protein